MPMLAARPRMPSVRPYITVIVLIVASASSTGKAGVKLTSPTART